MTTRTIRVAGRTGVSTRPDDFGVFDMLDDAVIVRDMDGIILAWNRAAEQLYGVSQEGAIGRSVNHLFEAEADGILLATKAELAATCEWDGRIHRQRKGSPQVVPVAAKGRILKDTDGSPSTVVEVTKRDAASEIGKNAPTLARLLSATGTEIFELDLSSVAQRIEDQDGLAHGGDLLPGDRDLVRQVMSETKIVSVLFDRNESSSPAPSSSELVGDNILSIWPEESAGAFVQASRAALLSDSAASSECRMLRDGTMYHAQITSVPSVSADGRKSLIVGIRDLSAEKEAYNRLEASERRFRHLFQYMPIGLTQVNAAGLVGRFQELRRQGVEDLSRYIDDHPEFLEEAIEDMHVEEVNEYNLAMFGATSVEEMRGPITRYWRNGMDTIRRSLEARYRGEHFFKEEVKITRMDGSVADVLYVASRHGSMPDRSLVGFFDISDRKRAEEALRRSERRYQDLFQAMSVSFWELDLTDANDYLELPIFSGTEDLKEHFGHDGQGVAQILQTTRVVDVNDSTLKLFGGAGKAELIGTIDRFWTEEAWADCATAIACVLKSGVSTTIETRLRRLDGSEFDAQFTLWIAADDKRRGLAAVADISGRVRAYNQLEQSEQRYRDLFQHIPIPVLQVNSGPLLEQIRVLKESGVDDFDGFLTSNPDFIWTAMEGTMIEQANEAAVKLLGATTAQDLEGPITPLFRDHPEIYARLLNNRYQAAANFEDEVKLTTFAGEVKEGILTVAFPSALAAQGITLNAFVDTTEKKQAEKRIRQIEAEHAHAARISMLGELTASIAHEVNQPLAAITTYGEAALRWLSRPTPELSEVHEIVTRIVLDAQRASSVIARVRNMASRRNPDQEVVLLDDVVAEALLFLKHEFQASKVTVQHVPAPDAKPVAGDRTQLQQVIVNLAVNAVQAMSGSDGQSRAITFRSVCDTSVVRCSVEDSGPGITAENAHQLFQSFFTTKKDGMGMGLPICRSIVEAHGGTISADNESSRGGARFSFVLPLASCS